MRIRTIATGLAVILLAVNFASAKDSPDKKRGQDPQDGNQDAARTCTNCKPAAQGGNPEVRRIRRLRQLGTNLFVLSTARGSGIAIDTSSKQETFMKMISAGAGLGIGVKDYSVIFVFENDKAYNDFPELRLGGFSAGGRGGQGSATSPGAEPTQVSDPVVPPGVWLYQITKNGLALQLTSRGYGVLAKHDDLNKKT